MTHPFFSLKQYLFSLWRYDVLLKWYSFMEMTQHTLSLVKVIWLTGNDVTHPMTHPVLVHCYEYLILYDTPAWLSFSAYHQICNKIIKYKTPLVDVRIFSDPSISVTKKNHIHMRCTKIFSFSNFVDWCEVQPYGQWLRFCLKNYPNLLQRKPLKISPAVL